MTIRQCDGPVALLRHSRVMCHQQNGAAKFAVEFPKKLKHFSGGFAIEISGGFVRKKQGGPIDERAGDSDPLLLASR